MSGGARYYPPNYIEAVVSTRVRKQGFGAIFRRESADLDRKSVV